MIECKLQHRDGTEQIVHYNPQTHYLYDNNVAVQPSVSTPYTQVEGINVRIAMGKKCNFSCTYCSQHMCTTDAVTAINTSVLIKNIVRVAGQQGVRNVQFWGGEPFVYFALMRELHALFLQHCSPMPHFSIVTNGSLLHGERLKWVLDNNIQLGISWDGPGQHHRSADIFKDPAVLASVKQILAEKPQNLSISPVLSRDSHSHHALQNAVAATLGSDTIILGDARLIVVVSEESRNIAIQEEDLSAFSNNMHKWLITEGETRLPLAHDDVLRFLSTLSTGESPSGTRCFVGKEHTITVDMAGNILTCQNFDATAHDSAGESHCLGNIVDMPELTEDIQRTMAPLVRLKERQHEKCQHCVVFAICKGGCPYSPAEYDDINCKCYYHQFLPVFGLALHKLTGAVLKEVRRV